MSDNIVPLRKDSSGPDKYVCSVHIYRDKDDRTYALIPGHMEGNDEARLTLAMAEAAAYMGETYSVKLREQNRDLTEDAAALAASVFIYHSGKSRFRIAKTADPAHKEARDWLRRQFLNLAASLDEDAATEAASRPDDTK